MKKILYILNSSVMGGATISFLNLLYGVKSNGYDIVVVMPSIEPILTKKIETLGGKCYYCRIVGSFYKEPRNMNKFLNSVKVCLSILKAYFLKVLSLCSLYMIVKKEKPDIIHTNVGVIQEGFFVARILRIPHVWHLREYQDLDFDLKILPNKQSLCRILKRSYVITITKDIRKHFNLEDCNKSITIYNGILRMTDVYSVFPKQKFFLCASRISPEKGHEGIINVFSKFHQIHSEYRLVILGFGEDDYINRLKLIADRNGCGDFIDWIGFTNDVTSYMKRATALIVNSKFEGFGRMTAEACFCSCMVIGRNTGGTKEILEQTGGMLFNTDDEMQKCLISLAAMSEEEYLKRVNKSSTYASDLFSIEKNIDNTLNFYNKVLQAKEENN